MGRVRTKTVKKSAKLVIEKYYPKLTLDFDTNKRICEEVADIPSKRLRREFTDFRNKIAGYVTHLMARMQKGPIRGISVKLQEEERERRDNYVPDQSCINTVSVPVDAETSAMLEELKLQSEGIVTEEVEQWTTAQRRPRRN